MSQIGIIYAKKSDHNLMQNEHLNLPTPILGMSNEFIFINFQPQSSNQLQGTAYPGQQRNCERILTCASVELIVLFLTEGCIAHNEVLGCMLTQTNTLTKHYYIQSSDTLLPPSQRDLYP